MSQDKLFIQEMASGSQNSSSPQALAAPVLQQFKLPLNAELIELVHDAIIVCDTEQRILLWNKSAEQLYKWTQQEALGQIYHEMLQSQLPTDTKESPLFFSTHDHWEGELRQTCQDGTSIIVKSKQTINRSADNQPPIILIANQLSTASNHIDQEQINQLHLMRIAREIGLWSWDIVNDKVQLSLDITNTEQNKDYTYAQFLQIIHPKDRKRVDTVIKNGLKTGADYSIEYRRCLRPDQTERWIKIIGRVIHNNRGEPTHIIGVATDITEQRNLETRLKATNRHLQVVLKTINDIFLFIDNDWNITYISKKTEELTQRPAHELLGKNLWDELPYLQGSFIERKIHEAVDTHKTLQFESLAIKTGLWYDVRLYPSSEGLIIYYHDITEHKVTKDALQASEARFSWLLETNIISIAIAGAEGEIYQANDAFLKLLGFTRKDLNERKINWKRQTAPEYRDADNDHLQEIQSYNTFKPYEKDFYDKQGKRISVIVAGIYVESGKKLITSFVVDVTAKKQLEKQKDTFMSITGHELRTPLTAINGSIQLAQRRLQRFMREKQEKLEPEVQVMIYKLNELLEQSLRQTRVQNRLINDLLDISRLAIDKLELNLQPHDLLHIVTETIEDLRYTAGKHEIYLKLPPQATVPVLVDSDRIGQVISNYVTNALKYSDPYEHVTVEVTLEMGNVRVWVHDKGPGLSEDDQKHIWESYYRTNDAIDRKGSGVNLGLGLHICQILIQRHNGEVGVQSRENEGSSFWFSLPIIQ